MQHDTILLVDFGSPFTQLIARRVRSAKVYCEVHPSHIDDAWLREFAASHRLKGIILSASHPLDTEPGSADAIPNAVFELGVPVLALGHSMQAMAAQLGGALNASQSITPALAQVRARGHSRLLEGIADHTTAEGHGLLQVWLAHGAQVASLPPGFSCIASDEAGSPERAPLPIAGMADAQRQLYALQWHPEVSDTLQGQAVLERFVLDICAAQADWVMANYVEEAVQRIRQQVGDEEVILGLSGGVDSSVAAALIHRAIGDQLTCVLVDHGLMRLNEADMVLDMLSGQVHAQVVRVNAQDLFLGELAGVNEPEQKRKIIGRLFVDVFKAEAAKLKTQEAGRKGATFLAQGTIYPDVIESGGSHAKQAAVIKSHHNVGGLPEQLGLKLLEPLRDLFKDEVRELGVALGLPVEMVQRHPFPGPGLGVRILGEVKKEYADLLRQADAIFTQELRNTVDEASGKNWYQLTSQAFAVFLPVRSVGVSGGKRTYEYAVALRAVITTDFMTADSAELPFSLLKKVAARIINEVDGINRVTYDVSTKPPATIEWE